MEEINNVPTTQQSETDLDVRSTLLPDVEYSKARLLLPKKVIAVHGCLGCEWKRQKDREGEPLCPFDYRKPTDMIYGGICPRRAIYLLSFSKDPMNIKNYTEWQRSYKKCQ